VQVPVDERRSDQLAFRVDDLAGSIVPLCLVGQRRRDLDNAPIANANIDLLPTRRPRLRVLNQHIKCHLDLL